jgi:hypothetical protein
MVQLYVKLYNQEAKVGIWTLQWWIWKKIGRGKSNLANFTEGKQLFIHFLIIRSQAKCGPKFING